jgi:anaerobic magnesium-protoporphyrin IX monomethyl ester cyclase
MKNYRRFYMRRAFLSYPWLKDRYKRKYMIGCLRAALKSGFERRFYDLGRIGYHGQKNVDFKFDESRVLTKEELVQLNASRERVGSSYQTKSAAGATACGGGPEVGKDGKAIADAIAAHAREAASDVPALSEPADILGEERIDEFLDPRGFARQRARAKRQAEKLVSLSDAELDAEETPV